MLSEHDLVESVEVKNSESEVARTSEQRSPPMVTKQYVPSVGRRVKMLEHANGQPIRMGLNSKSSLKQAETTTANTEGDTSCINEAGSSSKESTDGSESRTTINASDNMTDYFESLKQRLMSSILKPAVRKRKSEGSNESSLDYIIKKVRKQSARGDLSVATAFSLESYNVFDWSILRSPEELMLEEYEKMLQNVPDEVSSTAELFSPDQFEISQPTSTEIYDSMTFGNSIKCEPQEPTSSGLSVQVKIEPGEALDFGAHEEQSEFAELINKKRKHRFNSKKTRVYDDPVITNSIDPCAPSTRYHLLKFFHENPTRRPDFHETIALVQQSNLRPQQIYHWFEGRLGRERKIGENENIRKRNAEEVKMLATPGIGPNHPFFDFSVARGFGLGQAQDKLLEYFWTHLDDTFISDSETSRLASEYNLRYSQVESWFAQQRKACDMYKRNIYRKSKRIREEMERYNIDDLTPYKFVEETSEVRGPLTTSEIRILERFYACNLKDPSLKAAKRKEIAAATGINAEKIGIWFGNKRRIHRESQTQLELMEQLAKTIPHSEEYDLQKPLLNPDFDYLRGKFINSIDSDGEDECDFEVDEGNDEIHTETVSEEALINFDDGTI